MNSLKLEKVHALLRRHRGWQLAAAFAFAIALACIIRAGATHPIDSYAACVDAGNPILETEPPICRDGSHSFTGTPHPVAPTETEPMTSVTFDTLVDGDTHGDTPREQHFITSSAEWARYWGDIHESISPKPPILPVDFATSSVVAVNLGQHTTGGYGIKVTSISTGERGSVIDVAETSPGPTCVLTQSITNRYLIVRTQRLTEPVSFRITPETRTCN